MSSAHTQVENSTCTSDGAKLGAAQRYRRLPFMFCVAALVSLLAACSDVVEPPGRETPLPPEEEDRDEQPVPAPTVHVLHPADGALVGYGEGVTVVVAVEGSADELVSLTIMLDGEAIAHAEGPGSGFEQRLDLPADQPGEREVTAVLADHSGTIGTATITYTIEPWLLEPFTVVVIPDTQNMIGVTVGNNDMVAVMTEWIVEQIEDRTIEFVTHVGDVVDRGDDVAEWQRAYEQLGPLDGAVPYSVAIGDHDYGIEENFGSSTDNYTTYFGPDRYADYEWYGGSGPDGLSHYQYFESGGRTFLHVAMEFEARGPADDPSTPLGWARTIIEQHPDVPTIITTHAYLWDKPGLEGRTWQRGHLNGYYLLESGDKTYPGSTGQAIFEAVVKPYSNVFMVLSGHFHSGGGTKDGEYHQVSLNSAGLEVYEMLSNFQDYKNGGDGWMRLIEFQPGGGDSGLDRIEVSTYSPVRDEYQRDAASSFFFDLDLGARLGGLTTSGSHHP